MLGLNALGGLHPQGSLPGEVQHLTCAASQHGKALWVEASLGIQPQHSSVPVSRLSHGRSKLQGHQQGGAPLSPSNPRIWKNIGSHGQLWPLAWFIFGDFCLDRVLCGPGWPGSLYVVEDGLELLILHLHLPGAGIKGGTTMPGLICAGDGTHYFPMLG